MPRQLFRVRVLVAVVACFPISLSRVVAQTAPAPPLNTISTPAPSPNVVMTLHESTHLVILDVSVFDWKNSPVTGLTKDAFHLFEDGHEQIVRNFEEHTPIDPVVAREQLTPVAAANLPANTFSNAKTFPSTPVNVVVLDALTSPPYSQKGQHDVLLDYLRTAPPGTPFIILKLDTQLHLVQGLTTDPAKLSAAVETKPGEIFTQPGLNYLQRREIIGAAVDELIGYLAAIPGHKTIFWFSYLIGNDVSSNGSHDNPDDPSGGDLLCKWTDTLQQNRIDVYRTGSVDPGAVSSGLGCHVPRKIGNTIASAVDSTAHFYTLTYTPANANWDGHYRKLKVEVDAKGTPWKGIALDYRGGYFARPDKGSVRGSVVSTPSPPNAESTAMRQAMGLGAATPDEVIFEATVEPSAKITRDPAGASAPPGNFLSESLRTQGYRAYSLHFVVRADQLALIMAPDKTGYVEELETIAVVYDSLGHGINSKRSAVSVNFNGSDDPRLQTAAVAADLTTQIPASGDYVLRVGVHDLATNRVAAFDIPTSSIYIDTTPAVALHQ
ncbi:MAG: VWA domain-containing protein [Acidobacteriota bacterium]|nr:VWA domain-containing protein [Acidobacteriota bacterium]